MQSDRLTLDDLFTRKHLPSLLSAFFMLGVAYVVEHYANIYAFTYSSYPTSRHVGDIILDNIPAVDLNLIIVEGALIAIVVAILYVLKKPRYILFTLKALALFIIIRAAFISLTHLGIHPEQITPGAGFFDAIYLYLNFQTGFFFSGHTGLPFLMALIFWHMKRTRIVFLALSFICGVAVLLAHVHYSIDVFAAPFMAYGIYKIARYLYPRDYALIEEGR